LERQKVLEQMKTLRLEEIVARGRPAPPRAGVVLDDAEYERLLRKAYRDAFKTTPEQALREALAAAVATNSPGANVAAPSRPVASTGAGKGAVALLDKSKSLAELHQETATGAGESPAKPRTERELVRDELERRLASTMPVTEDDLLALSQRRMEAVRKYLITSGGVPAERLFPVAPKPGGAASGAARVVFSLN